MIGKKRILSILLAMLMVFAMTPLLPGSTQPVYAEDGYPSMCLGTGVLNHNINSTDGFIVNFGTESLQYYDGYEWWVINYDGKGNSPAARKGVMTLFAINEQSGWQKFNDRGGSNEYGGSLLQQAMDNSLDRMFSTAELNAISPRKLTGGSADYGQSGYDSNKIKGSSVENAYMWPLSVAEAAAVPQDILVGTNHNSSFWLRTPGEPRDGYPCVAYVDPGGGLNESGDTVDEKYDVRGALDIDLDAVLFTTSDRSTDIGADALQPVERVPHDYWSLTLLDDARRSFGVDSVTSTDGKTLQIKYSGAVAGENNYISAIIVNSSGEITYYGMLGLASDTAGASVTVNTDGKWNSANGDKLYVFNEEYNGTIFTDYSSDLQEITEAMIGDDGNWTGSGTAKDPYVISGKNGWNNLSDYVENGNSTQNVYFKLGDSIRVDRMVGTSKHPFCGVFDGAEYTLTFNAMNHAELTAPFRYIDGATIRNLNVTGSITGSTRRAAGLIGENNGSSTVTNCHISSEISGDNLIGGFCIGTGDGSLNITGCVFDGKITGTEECGGFVAWGKNGLHITNSIFAPQSVSATSGGTFYFNGGGTAVLTNCLYTKELGTTQGKHARSITAGKGVGTIGYGTGTEYKVSKIKAYSKGLAYKGTFYAGKDDKVPLTIADPGSSKVYTASAGTLTGSGKNYQIVMPDEDVVINCQYTKIAVPKNVKIEANASENGLLADNQALIAKWSADDSAAGYYITPYQIKNGVETDLCEPIKIDYPNINEGVVSYDLTNRIMIYDGDNADTGKFAFKVSAYNDSLTSFAVKSSNQIEIYKLGLGAEYEWTDAYILKGAPIAACISEIFSNCDSEAYSKWYIDSNNNYYHSKTDGTKLKLLGFMPGPAEVYHSLDELRSAAYLVPDGRSSDAVLSRNVSVYTLTESDLCGADGELHDYIEVSVERKASTGPADYGLTSCVCSRCNKSRNINIAPATQFSIAKTTYTYTGKAIKPAVSVKNEYEQVLKNGEDYTVSYSGNTNAGTATAQVELKGDHYEGSKTLTFKIAPKKITPAVTLSTSSYTWNGKVKKPSVTVKDGNQVLALDKDYTVTYAAGRKNAGTYKVHVTLKGNYNGAGDTSFKIVKAANPLNIKARTATVKYSKLKKSTQTLTATKVIKFIKNGQGKMSYTLSSVKKGSKSFNKYFKINKTNGKLTIKKGLKKGTYKVKVKVKAAGNANYKASAVKTVTFTIKVK